MEYNFKKIGKRIASERKKHGFETQNALIKKLQEKYFIHVGRNTISNIECGSINHFDCDLLAALCSEFDCDMGYLLCEYDCKYHQNADIQEVTGLSNAAIDNIKTVKQQSNRIKSDKGIDMLNLILSDYDTLNTFLSNLNLYMDNQYTCSGYFDEHGFKATTPGGIHLGKPSNEVPGGFDTKGIELDILETYALEEIKKALREWKNNFLSPAQKKKSR